MKKAVIAVLIIALAFSLCSCGNGEEQIYSSYDYFGALLKVASYTDDATFSQYTSAIAIFMEDLSDKLDESVEGSDLARFNNASDGISTEISEISYNLILSAKEIYSLSGGAYNPCVYYLVDLWGFSARFSDSSAQNTAIYDRSLVDGGYPLPDEKYVDAFKALCDFDKITLNTADGRYFITKNNTAVCVDDETYYAKIDLGGIAKGYAVEKIGDLADTYGITKGYVSFGTSSIRLLANKNNSEWDLKLTDPRYDGIGDSTYCAMKKSNISVATSGDYERYYFLNGVRYSHIIDADSGKPYESGVCSVTVLCHNAGLSDALSTALCVSGKEKIIAFAESGYAAENGIGIVATFITDNGYEVFSTEEITLTKGTRYEK